MQPFPAERRLPRENINPLRPWVKDGNLLDSFVAPLRGGGELKISPETAP